MNKTNRGYLEDYLVNCKQLNKSEHTLINYHADLKKFILWFEAKYNQSIHRTKSDIISEYKDFLALGGLEKKLKRAAVVYRFLNALTFTLFKAKFNRRLALCLEWGLAQEPLSVSSRRRHISSLKNFFEYLKQVHEDKSNKFKINPVKSKIHSIRLKDVDVNHTKTLQPEDWKKLELKTYRIKDRLMINLLYWGGLRIGELVTLKLEYIDFKGKTLKIVRKGGSIHHLKIEKWRLIEQLIRDYLEVTEIVGPYLFPNKKGGHITTRAAANLVEKLFKKAQVTEGLTPHSFRKACATRLYYKTKDLLFVRDYLNHTDAKVTQTYIDTSLRNRKFDRANT